MADLTLDPRTDEERRLVPVPVARVGAWSWRILVTAAAAALLGFLLLKLAVVVVPVVLALFLAAVLEPMAAALRRRRWKPGLAAFVVFVGSLLVLGVAVSFISSRVAGELGEVGERTSAGLAQVREAAQDRLDLSDEQIANLEKQLRSSARTGASGGIARQVIGGARLAVEVIGGFILTLFTLFFLVKDGHRMADWALALFPRRHRPTMRLFAADAATVMRQYLKATALTGLIDAILIGIGLKVIGVPLILPLALLTFLGGFFPIIGAFLAGMVAALVALVSNGPKEALLVVLVTVIVQQIEGNLLQPFILGPAVALHELATVLVVAAGLAVGGILGAFLSVPLLAIGVRTAHHYRVRNLPPEDLTLDPPEPPPPAPPPTGPEPQPSATADPDGKSADGGDRTQSS